MSFRSNYIRRRCCGFLRLLPRADLAPYSVRAIFTRPHVFFQLRSHRRYRPSLRYCFYALIRGCLRDQPRRTDSHSIGRPTGWFWPISQCGNSARYHSQCCLPNLRKRYQLPDSRPHSRQGSQIYLDNYRGHHLSGLCACRPKSSQRNLHEFSCCNGVLAGYLDRDHD